MLHKQVFNSRLEVELYIPAPLEDAVAELS